jgi:hypothetical protein
MTSDAWEHPGVRNHVDAREETMSNPRDVPLAPTVGPDILKLQRLAGNRAVCRWLLRQPRGHGRPVRSRPGSWSAVNPIGRPNPTRSPMDTELMADRTVREAMQAAWSETRADEPGRLRTQEQGGWIYIDLRTGAITVQRARPFALGSPGGTYRIRLSNPPLVPGSVIVGVFHTHPTGSSHDETDQVAAVPEFIVRGTGPVIESYGQPIRAGSWAAAADYPLFPP